MTPSNRQASLRQTSLTPATIAASLLLLVGFLAVLILEGRPWWCKHGFGLLSWVQMHCTSQNLFDPYSLSHVLHGVIFYWALRPLRSKMSTPWRFVAALAIEIAWEILENSPWVIERYRRDTSSFDYTGDSILNSMGDTLSSAVGFWFAWRYSWQAAVALFLVVELGLLFLIHDNLTLNVIMLLYPLESIKTWQLGAS